MRWSSGRLRVLISALLNENEQEGALGQRNIVILVGLFNDFNDSASALVVVLNALRSALGKPTFPIRSLLAANSSFSWVSAISGICSLLALKRNVFILLTKNRNDNVSCLFLHPHQLCHNLLKTETDLHLSMLSLQHCLNDKFTF